MEIVCWRKADSIPRAIHAYLSCLVRGCESRVWYSRKQPVDHPMMWFLLVCRIDSQIDYAVLKQVLANLEGPFIVLY
jgi:hypothetical protein